MHFPDIKEANVSAAPNFSLEKQGISTPAKIFWNLGTARLVESALNKGEGILAKEGPLVVETGKHTGRSASDGFTWPETRMILMPGQRLAMLWPVVAIRTHW